MAGSTSISTSSWDAATVKDAPSCEIVWTYTLDRGNPSGVKSWYASAFGASATSRKTNPHAPFLNPSVRTRRAGVPQTGTTQSVTNFRSEEHTSELQSRENLV